MCQNNCNCISDILNVIYLLQKNCSQCENAIDSCDKPILGQFACSNYNTRPVMLYTCNSNGTTACLCLQLEKQLQKQHLQYLE